MPVASQVGRVEIHRLMKRVNHTKKPQNARIYWYVTTRGNRIVANTFGTTTRGLVRTRLRSSEYLPGRHHSGERQPTGSGERLVGGSMGRDLGETFSRAWETVIIVDRTGTARPHARKEAQA